MRTENPVYGTPAVARDTVFALTNGCTLWSIPLTAPMSADSASIGCVTVAGPSVVRGGVLVATVRGEVILYDRARRAKVWTRQLGAELRQPPVVRNGQFVVAPTMGQVVSFR